MQRLLDADAAADMLARENSGFSVDASVRITLFRLQLRVYCQPLEHLLRYCARPPFALERLSVMRGEDGRIACVRYVLPRLSNKWGPPQFAPNHKLRPAVTALAIGNSGKLRDAATGGHAVGGHAARGDATADCCDSCDKPPSHDTSRIAWAKLMARVGEEFSFECPWVWWRHPSSCPTSTSTASDGIPCHGADGPREGRFQGRSAPTRKTRP